MFGYVESQIGYDKKFSKRCVTSMVKISSAFNRLTFARHNFIAYFVYCNPIIPNNKCLEMIAIKFRFLVRQVLASFMF